ncbi:SGNH/GDSL hydrolase family protein [Actinopolymorpha sp. B17G11]|uniref:SGNH/GDSL hydrolase family protein n=1 Tax=Actinopolymorpha sp. B17G11 TaxID=3160861 RepID=UPI0032E524E5
MSTTGASRPTVLARAMLTVLAAMAAVFGPAGATAATAAASATTATTAAAASATTTAGLRWIAGWGTAVQHPMPGNEWFGPNWSMDGFADQSLRQVVRVSKGGTALRVRLSNRYGSAPLRLTGATIARSGGGAAVRLGTVRPLTFRGSFSPTVPTGGELASDPTLLQTRALEKLTVTLYFATPTGPATFHEGGLTTTYRATGDHLRDHGGQPYAGETSHSWYYLSGVDVAGGRDRAHRSGGHGDSTGTVVALGDSITDGAISTPGADNRYPDELAERLAAAGRPAGVVNAGINGNKLRTDSTCLGESALNRFDRDVLGQPRIRTVIVLEGINDIGSAGQPDFGCGESPAVTAEQLIDAHLELIRAAHEHGVRIIGATLTPIKGNEFGYDTPHNEEIRDTVNHWIRTSRAYDAVVDFDRALADPADPDSILPEYDAGDHLHPNDAGMKAMAEAIDLDTLW